MKGEDAGRKGTISQYFTTLHCPVCDQLTQLGVCSSCRTEPQRVAVTLNQHIRQWESQHEQLLKVRIAVGFNFTFIYFIFFPQNIKLRLRSNMAALTVNT